MTSDLDPEQEWAFKQAASILKEQFGSFVILATTTLERGDSACRYSRHGDHHSAIGMLEQYKHILLKDSTE